MNINEAFGDEFSSLGNEVTVLTDTIIRGINNIKDIPPITEQGVCQKLEIEYLRMSDNAFLLAQAYMKISQLYHYVYIVNNGAWPSDEDTNGRL